MTDMLKSPSAPEARPLPPISLYVHTPWCLKKCPYCDFNSHTFSGQLPEEDYLAALIADLAHDQPWLQGRPISSIFFGGGTPSLLSPNFFARFLDHVHERLDLCANLEITMEANPGTLECAPFTALRKAGINRISLGIQSLSPTALESLGRIHSADTAKQTLLQALDSDFRSVNADLMFGLPNQSQEQALGELQELIDTEVPHLSWYQLTLEPNTQFYKAPPPLPTEDHLAEMAEAGQSLLSTAGLQQYEVSAFSRTNHPCQHNLNYWRFGDYLGIGAGAHGKITQTDGTVLRTTRTRLPQHYLQQTKPGNAQVKLVHQADLCFEFCLNRFRLFEPFSLKQVATSTGLSESTLIKQFAKCIDREWLKYTNAEYQLTPLGHRFLDDLVAFFLPSD